MARLRVPAPNFYASLTEPSIPSRYIKVVGGVESGTTLTSIGRDAIDIWSCMLARCQMWELTFSGSGSGTDPASTGSETAYGNYTFGYSGEIQVVVDPLESVDGYAAHPEVGTAYHKFFEQGSGMADGMVGEWDVVGESAGDPFNYSGEWQIGASVGFSPTGFEYSGSGEETPFAGPLCVGTTLYIPFSLQISMAAMGTFPSPNYGLIDHFVTTVDVEYIPELGPVDFNEVGTLTINVPNWRTGSGYVSVTMPLYAPEIAESPPGSPGTHTITATLKPAMDSYFKYGSGSANENPVWRSDGMVNLDPLS